MQLGCPCSAMGLEGSLPQGCPSSPQLVCQQAGTGNPDSLSPRFWQRLDQRGWVKPAAMGQSWWASPSPTSGPPASPSRDQLCQAAPTAGRTWVCLGRAGGSGGSSSVSINWELAKVKQLSKNVVARNDVAC